MFYYLLLVVITCTHILTSSSFFLSFFLYECISYFYYYYYKKIKDTLVGFSGEMADMQSINETLASLYQDDINQNDGYVKGPSEVFSYLRNVMYRRRGKGDPLWNQVLVGGFR